MRVFISSDIEGTAGIVHWEQVLNGPEYEGGRTLLENEVNAAIDGAAKKVTATYAFPYQHHVTMEPMNATARVTDDKCEVWCGTQNGEAALAAASEACGLPVAKCDVYKLLLGGGFGRRGRADYVRQAVLIAKEMPGTPVKLIWSREEDMTHGTYHPNTMCKLTGGLDAQGNLVGLHVRISGQSILASLLPQNLVNGMDPVTFQGLMPTGVEAAYGYTVPNLLIDHAMRNPHITAGFWRGVNVNQNALYIECFMDELARAAGQDPLAFRRKLMAKHPKNLAVLNAVAEKIGWDKPVPQGVFRGLAQHMGYVESLAVNRVPRRIHALGHRRSLFPLAARAVLSLGMHQEQRPLKRLAVGQNRSKSRRPEIGVHRHFPCKNRSRRRRCHRPLYRIKPRPRRAARKCRNRNQHRNSQYQPAPH